MIVTEQHLNDAIEAIDAQYQDKCPNCILAQAFGESTYVTWRFSSPIYHMGMGIRASDTRYFDETGQEIARLFDSEEYEKLREMLPLEVHIVDKS